MGFSVLTDRERTMVERELKKLSNAKPDKNLDSTTPSTQSTILHKTTSSLTAVNAFLQSVGHESTNMKDKRTTLVEEFRSYRILASKFMEMDGVDFTILQFWSTHAHELPLLSSFARRFLCTPGTSVPAETAFSVSSFIGRKERCRLTPDNLAATVFLKDKLQ